MNIKVLFRSVLRKLWLNNTIILLKRPANLPLNFDIIKKYDGIDFVQVSENNIYDCGEFEDVEHYVPIYRDMISKGDDVQFGYLNGKCVFRHAIKCSGDITFEEIPIKKIDNNCVYSHYAYCAPWARGNGFLTKSLFLVAQKFINYDIYTLVYEDNYSSLRSYFRNEYYPYKYVTVKNRFFHANVYFQDISNEKRKEIVDKVMNN